MPAVSKASARPATSPLMPTAAPISSRPSPSNAGRYSVERNACFRVITPTSRSPSTTSAAARCRVVSRSKISVGGVSAGTVNRSLGHHVVHLGESVHPGRLDLAERPQRPAVLDHDRQSMGAFGQQRQGLADRGVRTHRDRRVVDRVRTLDLADHRPDHVGRNVLRNDRHPTPPGDRLGHSPPGDGGHVGHDQRKSRADGVRTAQIDIEPGDDRRSPGHHEHVGIGQVVGRHRLQKSHDVIVANPSRSRTLGHRK